LIADEAAASASFAVMEMPHDRDLGREDLYAVPRRHTAVDTRGQAPDWELRDDARRIERTFRFRNFREALAFVQRVGELAESEGHHPDISFGWGYATVSLSTKKIKGLHENDFIMASKIDRMLAS
jgi:4a-hydroxytetrahydrobiopterin dehydratase